MVKSYCVKQRKKTDCVPNSETLVQTKNGRLMMKCKCVECGITKTGFGSSNIRGKGILDPVVKGINIGKLISTTLFPQTKQMFKDFESGKIAKEVVNKRDGIQTKRFWKPSKKTIVADHFLKGKCTRVFPYKGGKFLNVDCD